MPRRKNILLISIDDGGAFWRFRDVFGAHLQTPNLDRICAKSSTFTSAYCQAPICGPSRNSLMSGLAPHQTGILDNYTNLFSVLRPEQLWQFRLKRAGYYCSTAGKVHHGFAPLPADIHNVLYSHPPNKLTLGPPRTVPTKRYGGLTGGAATTEPEHDPLYYDHQSATDAVDFLEGYDARAPFYREVGFHHPHIPFRTPMKFKELYKEEDFKQPEEWADGFDTADYPTRYMPENIDLRYCGHWRKSVRNYFSAYSHVDSQIGRVWDALQASPHAKDTVVVILSDHGFHLGDKNRMRKFTLWEESCRVPLIIHDPAQASREIADPVALLDVGPTILDYTDCTPLRGTQGRSLRPQIMGASNPDRAVPTFLFGNASMRKGTYRVTLYENGDSEVHDVEKDPWLTKNLAQKFPTDHPLMIELHDVSAAHGLDLSINDNARMSFGAVGNLDESFADPRPSAPGARVHFSTLNQDGAAPLPEGFTKMHYGADTGGGVEAFAAIGNSADNELLFPGSFNRFTLTVLPGPSQNRVIAEKDDLVVYCEGPTNVRAGNARCVLYGGASHDVMRTGTGQALIDGGAGSSEIYAGAGPTEIVSGAGTNKIISGEGPTQITVNGGSNAIELGGNKVTLSIQRTGLPQRITGFEGGTIDVADWAPLGAARLKQCDQDTVLTCASELVVFCETNADDLRQYIVGTVLN